MKKLTVILAALALGAMATQVPAQVSVDPNDDFYRQVQSWELRGIVSGVPPMRPYPLANIKEILRTVIEKGQPADAEIARGYWERITGKPWYAFVEAELTYKHRQDKTAGGADGDKLVRFSPGLRGDVAFYDDFVSLGYAMGVNLFTTGQGDFIPLYQPYPNDSLHDPAEFSGYELYLDLNDVVAVGKPGIFAQAGIYRSGFGPFLDDSITLNDSGYHRANFSLSIVRPRWSYTQLLAAIGATSNYDDDILASNKYLAFHALSFNVTPKLSVSYYEAAAFGRRLDPSYLLPAPYYIAENVSGWGDSVFMGISASYKLYPGLMLAADLFVDDFDLNKLLKLKLDAKNRIAFTAGAIYTPENSICQRAALDYTFITPYTYTHWDYPAVEGEAIMPVGTVNYQNYTNNGLPIGSALDPNSDRVSLTVDFRPLPRLRLSTHVAFTRHANVCESLSDDEALTYLLADARQYATDGSIYTHSMFEDKGKTTGKHVDTAWEHLNFLTQEDKMVIVQAGIDASYAFRRRQWGQVSLTFSYLFEYVKNKGVDAHLYPGGLVKDNGNGTYTYAGKTLSEAQVVEEFKDEWRSNFRDVWNHYVSVGMHFEF